MTILLTEIEEKARSLNPAEKAALIRVLISDLDGPSEADFDVDVDVDVENAWIAEAKRRHRELVEGQVKGVPGKQAFETLRARLAR